MVGHCSCVLVHGGLDDFLWSLLAPDQSLDMFHCLGGKVLLTRFSANTGRHVFNQVELAAVFQRVRDLRFDHRFFHHITSSICLPNPEVDPDVRIGLVNRDDLDQRPGWVAALNVQWPATTCESQDQADWPILVLGIVLNHLASIRYRLFQLGDADVPYDRLIYGVLREFVLPCSDLHADVIK